MFSVQALMLFTPQYPHPEARAALPPRSSGEGQDLGKAGTARPSLPPRQPGPFLSHSSPEITHVLLNYC